MMRKSNINFSVKSYNWLSVSIVFVATDMNTKQKTMMRKSNINFSVESYNWLSVSIVFVQIQIQSGKQYTTCTLHYIHNNIVEYIQYNNCALLLKASKLMDQVPFLRTGHMCWIITML